MTTKERKNFFRFLKELGVYKAFTKKIKHKKENPFTYLKHARKNEAISNAFAWLNSPEGFHFWSNINMLWACGNKIKCGNEITAEILKEIHSLNKSNNHN